MRFGLYATTLLAAASLGGCYKYIPAAASPERGTAVRAHLQQPLQVPLTEISANNITLVDGEVAVSARDTLYLSATRLLAPGGAEFLPRGETVALPRPALARLEQRVVDTQTTAISIGGGILLAILAHLTLGDAIFGGKSGPGPQNPR